jgi:PilX N-terminal
MKPSSERQQGSALIFALLAIVFLTVIGLSLAMVTETDMLIGANEQVAEETFVAAESALAVGLDELLVNNDATNHWFALEALAGDRTRIVGDNKLGYVADNTDLYPVFQDCAPRSDCTESEEDKRFAYYFMAQFRARRLAWPANESVPDCETESNRATGAPQTLDYFNHIQAEKTLSVGFYSAPLAPMSGLAMVEVFGLPNQFGCDPILPSASP